MDLWDECERLGALVNGRQLPNAWKVVRTRVSQALPSRALFECAIESQRVDAYPRRLGFKTLLEQKELHARLIEPDAPLSMFARTNVDVPVSEREMISSWERVTAAVVDLARRTAPPRDVEVKSGGGARLDDGSPLLLITTVSGRNAFTATLHTEHRVVRVDAELTSGGWWHGSYRIDAENIWYGPIASGAEPQFVVGFETIARELLDGWLTATVPHH